MIWNDGNIQYRPEGRGDVSFVDGSRSELSLTDCAREEDPDRLVSNLPSKSP